MPGDYETGTQRSKELFERAKRVFAGGVNHNARFYNPYPIFAERAKAQHLWDADGRRYVDYWMGHMALVLGHSPSVVVEELAAQAGRGTLFGTGSRLAVELGEEIQDAVACAEKLRFCNTGAEATMYLVRLARGFTGKKTVVKMAGGWHGYNTELNKGVHQPFDASESSGILRGEQEHVKTVKFNDIEAARLAVKGSQGDVAAILLEPVLGAGGCIPADRDYLRGLRELADSAGALLAFDEIVTGFRVAFGGAMEHYAVTPDLATFGKVVGGGLPLGLVCGRKEVIDLADPSRTGNFVSIGGGTFSENPMTMVAGLATIRHLKKMKSKIYPTLAEEGEGVRLGVDRAFAERGIETHSTGLGSLFLTHFGLEPKNAEDAAKESKSTLHDYGIHMMTRGV
ncbi:MAG TPA: aminotransferase class III-fold pyridoxal phosphate-dependent enzyme, partial [Nitrososphaerales archaeon]|nr:aminotransferase class III-fold pyridoxal phosphate-dependent enzyme [Nitrososphaerales archaeon]